MVYNAALEERIGAWKWERRSVTRFDQFKLLTGSTEAIPGLAQFGLRPFRGALVRLDLAFQAFFRRCQCGEKSGFPRFRGEGSWDAIRYTDPVNWRLALNESYGRLYLQGIGYIKVKTFRHLNGEARSITVRRRGKRWEVAVQYRNVPTRQPAEPSFKIAAVDLGVARLATVSWVDIVSGERGSDFMPSLQPRKRSADPLEEADSALGRCKKGSKRRARAKALRASRHRKVANQRKNACHHVSKVLAEFGVIGFEKLSIQQMTKSAKGTIEKPGRNVAAKSGLNRVILDSGWGMLRQFTTYKAESAGGMVLEVDPRHSSQECARCGHKEKKNRPSQAEFRCQSCGYEANADDNASDVLLSRTLRDLGHGPCLTSKGVQSRG